MRHEIQITEEDIERGQCGNRFGCALARALTRHFPQVVGADVDLFEVRLFFPHHTQTLFHTDESAKFVFEFDREVLRVDPQMVVLVEGDDEEGPTGASEGEVPQ